MNLFLALICCTACILHVQAGHRSAQITVVNNSSKDFQLSTHNCVSGKWSTKQFPTSTIGASATSVFRLVSRGFLQGVECKIKYETADGGSSFELDVQSPLWGRSQITETHSKDTINVIVTTERRSKAQIRVVIQDKAGRKREAYYF